ncbi:MAG: helix-turn-helix transcriptional regulator [Chloroflexi bacterium]|nr:helix-turn-helix transcriptional regulator [Chloroflexota bacterium]
MRERLVAAATPPPDPYKGIVLVQATPCYDLLVSLRALYNPRTFETTRGWAAATKAKLDPSLYERGKFFFQGSDTALGYGAGQLVAGLGDAPQPQDLIEAVRAADSADLALRMLDTGETSDETLAIFSTFLGRTGTAAPTASIEAILRELPVEWARRVRRVLGDPAGIQAELADVLELYHAAIFALEVPHTEDDLRRAATMAEELLRVLPTAEVIERLTGGYTLGDDLALRQIVLAPSVFIHPFMSSRIDQTAGRALVIFGARSNAFLQYDPVPIDPELVRAMKALADPGRLRVLRLLGRGPMFGVELVEALRLAQPTVHHHLAQLRSAGLVRQERTKGGMRYTVRRDAAGATIKALERLLGGG